MLAWLIFFFFEVAKWNLTGFFFTLPINNIFDIEVSLANFSSFFFFWTISSFARKKKNEFQWKRGTREKAAIKTYRMAAFTRWSSPGLLLCWNIPSRKISQFHSQNSQSQNSHKKKRITNYSRNIEIPPSPRTKFLEVFLTFFLTSF